MIVILSITMSQYPYHYYQYIIIIYHHSYGLNPKLLVSTKVMTKGVMARHTGEMVPSQCTGALGTTVPRFGSETDEISGVVR